MLAWCETIDPGLGRAKRTITFERFRQIYYGEPLQYCHILIQIKSPSYVSLKCSTGLLVSLVCCFFLQHECQGSEALLCQYCVCVVEVVKISAVEVQGDFYFFLFDIEHYHRNLGSY